MDLETQDHILNYQLPVAITRYKVGLVVIDSITSNYRAEHSSNTMLALSMRSSELAKLGQMLRNLAVKEDIAIVLANQVSDRFDEGSGSDAARPGVLNGTAAGRESGTNSPIPRARTETTAEQHQSTIPSSSPANPSSSHPAPEDDHFDGSYLIANPAQNAILSLLHQERFFTGWGDDPRPDTRPLKTPALGFFWSTQIACRIALKKEEVAKPTAVVEDHSHQKNIQVHAGSESIDVPTHESVDESKPKTSETESRNSDSQSAVRGTVFPPSQRSILHSAPERATRRTMKLVFAPWTSGLSNIRRDENRTRGRKDEIEFEIWKGGLRGVLARDESRGVN